MAAAHHLNKNIGGYVAGNLVISLICGAVTTLSLYAFSVPYSLALGVFMAVFDLIPLVGATIGSFVVIAAAFIFVDVRAGIALFIIVNVYQQVENHILQPIIYGRTVQIPSLTVLVAVLCGGAVLGLIGALLAIPIAATIQTVAGELLEERAERIEAAPGSRSRDPSRRQTAARRRLSASTRKNGPEPGRRAEREEREAGDAERDHDPAPRVMQVAAAARQLSSSSP